MTSTVRRLIAGAILFVALTTVSGCRHVGVEVHNDPGGISTVSTNPSSQP